MSRAILVVGSYLAALAMRVAEFPRPGQTVMAMEPAAAGHGGKGSNQAVQAARCGAPVRLVAAIGRDPAGAAARAQWQAEAIDLRFVHEAADLPTGTGFILVDRAGENQIAVDPGASRACDGTLVAAAPEAAFAGAAVVLTQLEIPESGAAAALHRGKNAAAVTILNPTPAPPALPDALWDDIDILTPNEGEAEMLAAGGSIAANGRALARRVGRAVLVTAGANGAFAFFRDGRSVHIPAPPVEVRDTTGAGDAFNGAFAARLAETDDLLAACRFGVAAGSLACTGAGTLSAFARRRAIAALADRIVC